jgi:superfamily II DNA/RNA helicase
MSSTSAGPALDVFALRDFVIDEYSRFATSFTTIHAPDIKRQIEAIYGEQRYWPEPLLQINPSFKRSTDVASLVARGALDPVCSQIFQANGAPLSLYKHQEQAIALAESGESYVVTTGTGSGKSLCFFVPIVHRVLTDKREDARPRTRAIVIYPMNALANSQLEELGKFVGNVAGAPPITFARYTGQEDAEERARIADDPPDILLTNFMMLELLMTRQDEVDRRVIDHCVGLRFLVLDELHTYRGRQGADVALLVRRVRERLRPERLQCIGTSATMASEGSLEDKNRVVARVASALFATSIPESNVVVETLERITDPAQDAESVASSLGAAIDAGIAPDLTNAALARHPLAIWVETRLGIAFSEVDQRWVRARPMTMTEAVSALARASGRSEEACRTALRDLLLVSSVPEAERTGDERASPRGFFAFKLHQFISGAGHAFSTLEPAGTRTVTVDGQQFLPGQPDKRLYPVHFCRECGHEYHPVRLVDEEGTRRALPRGIDDAPPERDAEDQIADDPGGAEQFGFLTLHPAGDAEFAFDDREEDYPESWIEYDAKGNPRLRPYYRRARAVALHVAPDGRVGSGARAWFIPGTFRFCLRCGTTQTTGTRDRTRLASLSAEGRSSATTVLVTSALRWMHGPRSGLSVFTRKVLGFTDNRQDAALQAGHFNDFVFVSLVRAAFLGALRAAGSRGLRSDELGVAMQRALGFDRAAPQVRTEWLQEPGLKGVNLQEAERTLRQVLAYRAWYDQRRGWRYTNPNLEQLGLVRVEYQGLDDLAADSEEFAGAHPLLRRASPEVRARLYRALFDHLRKWLAIKTQVLDAPMLEQLKAQALSRIRPPWGIGADEQPRGARWLMVSAPKRREGSFRDDDLIVRGGSRSALGRTLRDSRLWGGDGSARELKSGELDALIGDLLRAASVHGLVSRENTSFDAPGWRLSDAALLFRVDEPRDGRRTPGENAFFRDLYGNLADLLGAEGHPLFGFEAREHTAQVDGERRAIREKRFRYGDKERQELAADQARLGQIGEANRFLPVLFCSPTMELGVDISALNVVHLRNVPPTPANYAQRSGRAGRSGQAALVLTYAAAQSPHDQYFFREPRAMVHGEVKAPLLDLANRDLIDSHLQAVWLSSVEVPLAASISELLVLTERGRPVRGDLLAVMRGERVRVRAIERIERVLDLVAGELTPESAPWYTGREAYAASIAAAAVERFDRAFGRWRDLFDAAERQREAARRTMDDYAAPYAEKRNAQARHAQAIDQLELLQRGTSSLSSDFYTYRYLATEGFLPGYNFPRLPLMAYVPATRDGGGKQAYLQRPRFLALAEFGPNSLVYHEGRAYRVVRALLSLGQREAPGAEVRLPTLAVRICVACGAGHFDDHASMCHACGASLGAAEIVDNVYRIENVATKPVERITANDEERRRQGFDLQTTFRWARRDHELDVRNAEATDAEGVIARLAYGPGAEITRLNKGLRRRADKKTLGFKIDPVSGYWTSDEPDEEKDPTAAARQWIVPSVQDHKNALLFTPDDPALGETTLTTLQHALLRGVEAVFQLEQGEVLAEPMPTREVRKGFLCYEATEGGAGVLARLVAEPASLAAVARRALQIMHFELPDETPPPSEPHRLAAQAGTACVAACYRCLMSYYNQPDHEHIDRRDEAALRLLLRLASARVRPVAPARPPSLPPSSPTDAADWTAQAASRGVPPPDVEPLAVEGARIPLVWRRHYVVALRETPSPEILARLDALGFEAVRFDADPDWSPAFARLLQVLGRGT